VTRFTASRTDVAPAAAQARARRERPDRVELLLRTPADPASLAIIRHALGGTASALGLDPAGAADVRLALTEAVTAAIRRTGDGQAMIEVRAELIDRALRIAVRDEGGALPINDDLPLPLVAAISDAVELSHLPGGGTEVAMTFGLDD
jgi:serine/threonine-protein kinase RsbW